jgi:hypothetical protein
MADKPIQSPETTVFPADTKNMPPNKISLFPDKKAVSGSKRLLPAAS